MKLLNLLKALCFVFIIFPSYVQAKNSNEDNGPKVTNVILFIGDGMSLAQWQTGMIMSGVIHLTSSVCVPLASCKQTL